MRRWCVLNTVCVVWQENSDSWKESKYAHFPKYSTISWRLVYSQDGSFLSFGLVLMINSSTFFLHTDEIHRCNAFQSPSVHHRIDQREWSCPSGLPSSRITHEPQHDWSLLTRPEPVPYSQSTHRSYPSESKWKCLSSPLVTNYRSPWVIPMFSQSYLSGDYWLLYSLTSSLERLDKCCPPITWLLGYSNDLPTYGVNHLSISKKNGWSCTN